MAAAATADEASFVTIGIDREVFAVPVETVIEILEMRTVFRIPEAPTHLKGLIDVRGRAVPVIDLRIKLGMPAIAADLNTRIVVLDVPVDNRRLAVGLIGDRVFDVIVFNAEQIEPAPDIGVRWNSDYIRGIARRLDSFVVVLDLPKLFSGDALHLLSARSDISPGGDVSTSSPSGSKAA